MEIVFLMQILPEPVCTCAVSWTIVAGALCMEDIQFYALEYSQTSKAFSIIYFYEFKFQINFTNLMVWEIIMGNNNLELTFFELPVT